MSLSAKKAFINALYISPNTFKNENFWVAKLSIEIDFAA